MCQLIKQTIGAVMGKVAQKNIGRLAALVMVAAIVIQPVVAEPAAKSMHTGGMMQDLFRFDAPASVADWMPTDDRVMGGISQSRMRHDPAGHAVFEGVMSLERNGGFASVRAGARVPTPSTAAQYVLEVRGDGKRYMLNLRTSGAFDGVSYQASFDTTADKWTTVVLPVSAFVPNFRGRRVVNAPPLDPAAVRQFGLMIADKQDGRFALGIRRISAVITSAAAAPGLQ